MSTETETGFGIGGTIGWTIGGAVSGAIAATAFGVVMWLLDPEILTGAIPAIYGFDPSSVLGMTIHILHGVVLGLVFGFLVTRSIVLGVVRTNVEDEPVSEFGLTMRVVAAGFVFGLAVWAILPVVVMPVLVAAIGEPAAENFPSIAVESMLGHMVFGLVLGLVFAVTVDLYERSARGVLEE